MLIKTARKIVILVLGSTILALGLALLVLPGPAFVVIPIGLAVLGTEFIWARKLLDRVKAKVKELATKQLSR